MKTLPMPKPLAISLALPRYSAKAFSANCASENLRSQHSRMKTLIRTLALALLGIASTASHAQVACPPGTMPYGTGQGLSFCGPMPDTNEQAPQWQALPVKWASRWGAVATDGNRGSLGMATDVSSQSAAEKLAMQNCKDKGGA